MSVVKVASVWPIVGIWETSSLDQEAVEKDEEYLKAILAQFPQSASSISIAVTIHGRRWTFRQVGPRIILVGVD